MIFCSLKEYIHTLHERTGNGEGFVFFLSHTYKACPRRVAPHRTERAPLIYTRRRRRTLLVHTKKNTNPLQKKGPGIVFCFPASVSLPISKCACPRLEIKCRIFRMNDPFMILNTNNM